MNAIIIFGFMLPVAAIRVWKLVVGVDWKTAFHACSANESRLPKVRMRNNGLEVEDHIPFDLSSTFWLGAVYEPLNIDTLNGEISYSEGAGPWITITRICTPTAMTRGHRNDKYWTYDIRRIHLDPTTSGQTKSACTYCCAGAVLRGDCSISSGIDAICVSDKVDTSYSSTTSTASTKVSTGARNFSLVYTDGTLSTHFSTDTIKVTKDSTSIRTQMTEHSNNKTSTSTLHLRSTSIAFPNSTLKSQNDNTTSSTSKRVLEENWFLYWGITGAVSILLTVSMIVIIILVMKLRQSRRQVVHARKNDRISMQQLDDLASYQNLDDRNRDSKNIYDTLAP